MATVVYVANLVSLKESEIHFCALVRFLLGLF